MQIKQKAFLKSEIFKQEKNGAWAKRLFLLDTGEYMVNVCWTGVDYRPNYYRNFKIKEEAERFFEMIRTVKNVQKYLIEDKL